MLVFEYSEEDEEDNLCHIKHSLASHRKTRKEWPLEYIREIKIKRYLM
jgi:hypothetical protein